MRIVSSDGGTDIPYDGVAFFVTPKANITYSFDGNIERWLCRYKNEKRSLEVMKDIRDAYAMGRKVFVMPKE